MAKPKIPAALDMRRLKYGAATDAERAAAAQALRKADRRDELLLLYERHPDDAVLAEEADWAVANGRGFHLLSVHRIGGKVTDEQFRACARKALELDRPLDARNCYLAVGDDAEIEAFVDRLPESMRPASPIEDQAPPA